MTFEYLIFLKGLSSSIVNICTSFVHIKLGRLPGVTKIHLKYSNKNLVKSQFFHWAAKPFDICIVLEPNALFWQINQNITDEKQIQTANVR